MLFKMDQISAQIFLITTNSYRFKLYQAELLTTKVLVPRVGTGTLCLGFQPGCLVQNPGTDSGRKKRVYIIRMKQGLALREIVPRGTKSIRLIQEELAMLKN